MDNSTPIKRGPGRPRKPRDPNGPKTTRAQLLASQKYKAEHCRQTTLCMRVEDFEVLESFRQLAGESRQGFIVQAVKERIDRMKKEIAKQ